MEKIDLKYGYMVKFAYGRKAVFMPTGSGDIFDFCDNAGNWISVNDFDSHLNYKESKTGNVVEIYGFASTDHSAFSLNEKNRPLLWKRKELVELTKFQHELLEKMSQSYNYLTRNKSGNLRFHSMKPRKIEFNRYCDYYWYSTGAEGFIPKECDVFDFVQWEDEEPICIQDLLKNCEVIE